MAHSSHTPIAEARTVHAWAWTPLLLIVAVIAWSALSARGPATDSALASTVNVTGSIASEVHIDPTGCAASALAIGDLVPGDPWKTVQDNGGTSCALTFGTLNSSLGADLVVLEDPAALGAGTGAMKCAAASCGADTIPDRDGAETTAGQSGFGMQLLASGGAATTVWPAAPAVKDVQDAADVACQTANTADGTCTFTYGASSSGQAPGLYQADVQYLVLAR